jgi:O-antigen ligase
VAELVATYGVAAFILCLPLEFTAGVLHQQLSRFVLAAMGLAFVYLLATRRRALRVPRSLSAWLLGSFLLASLLSWALTRNPGSTSAIADIVLYPFAALLISNLVLTEEDHRRAWGAMLVSGLIVAGVGGALYLTHTHIWAPNPLVANRLNITFADPNITARFLTICACAAVLLYSARRLPGWLSMATAVACGIILPLTYSRSGLALFITMVVLAVVIGFDHRRAAAIGAVALLAFAISTGVNPDTRQRATDAVGTLTGLASTPAASSPSTPSSHPAPQAASALDDNRRYLIAAGLSMFKDHPVLGVGLGGYQHKILTAYRRFLPSGYTDSVSHTSFVTVMAEQGLVGTLLFLAFLLALARESLRVRLGKDPPAIWGTVPAMLVIPIFLFSQFEARFLQEPYLWLCLAMFYSARRLGERSRATAAAVESVRREPVPTRSVEVA